MARGQVGSRHFSTGVLLYCRPNPNCEVLHMPPVPYLHMKMVLSILPSVLPLRQPDNECQKRTVPTTCVHCTHGARTHVHYCVDIRTYERTRRNCVRYPYIPVHTYGTPFPPAFYRFVVMHDGVCCTFLLTSSCRNPLVRLTIQGSILHSLSCHHAVGTSLFLLPSVLPG